MTCMLQYVCYNIHIVSMYVACYNNTPAIMFLYNLYWWFMCVNVVLMFVLHNSGNISPLCHFSFQFFLFNSYFAHMSGGSSGCRELEWEMEGLRFKPQCRQNLEGVLLVGDIAKTPSEHHRGGLKHGATPKYSNMAQDELATNVACLHLCSSAGTGSSSLPVTLQGLKHSRTPRQKSLFYR